MKNLGGFVLSSRRGSFFSGRVYPRLSSANTRHDSWMLSSFRGIAPPSRRGERGGARRAPPRSPTPAVWRKNIVFALDRAPPAAIWPRAARGAKKLRFFLPGPPLTFARRRPQGGLKRQRAARRTNRAAAAARIMRFPAGNRFLAGRQACGWGLGRRAPFRSPSPAKRRAAALPPLFGVLV